MPDGRSVQLAPLARAITERFLAEYPDELERHDAAAEWCRHDNQYVLAWVIEDLRLPGRMSANVRWLARVLEARGYPLERLERSLTLVADVVAAAVPSHAAELRERLAAVAADVRVPSFSGAPSDDGDGAAVRHEYLTALLRGEPAEARRAIDDAVERGVSARTIYLDVLGPALHEIGELWASGRISVADEHLATATTQVLLARLAPRLRREPRLERRAVVASLEGELHALGARFVADFLEGDGWTVLELGASTPRDALVSFVAEAEPHLVAISTTLTTNLEGVRDVVARLRALPNAPLIAVGGQAYAGDPELARHVEPDVFANDAGELADRLREELRER